MTLFKQLIGKLRTEAVALGMDDAQLGAEGRAVLDALDAWGHQAGRAGASGYPDVRTALTHLGLKDYGMGEAIRQLDQKAEALHHALYGKP
ncbi:hypothetical protein [Cupriavidus sp. D39]|uniref:hypothetical protein n=1 Tax=Cupriavidus sp. D39 TaxID=2997877 RepID=UPI0022700089|nr:hypothetical protein [Cupriavidus sp. D39]MCY0852538.1 hypothetical protein [Cupriavidus sp. D39]